MESSVSMIVAGMLGQIPGAEVAVPTESVEVQSVWDFVLKGGPMMIPLGFCSLLALGVIVERLISLRRSRVIPPGFLDGLAAQLNGDSNGYDRATEYCRQNGSPIANILAAGMGSFSRSIEVIEKRITEAGEREMMKLRKYLRLLSVVAAIAPLMGLLGTIFGMIRAFQTVAVSGDAMGKTELMAKGIYEAMITTAAGLMLAIPVLVCYHWISAKIDRLVVEMDQLTVEFVEEHVLAPAQRDQTGSAGAPAEPARPKLEITEQSEPVAEIAAAS